MKVFFLLLLIPWVSWATELSSQPYSPDGTVNVKEKAYRMFVGEMELRVPFRTRISEPFKEGQTIHAKGRVASDATRIGFNIMKGPEEGADIPFHLSIRFDEGIFNPTMVFNTFKNGSWNADEQRVSCSLKADEVIDLRIRIIGGKFLVYVNRVLTGTFDQRESLDDADIVVINGDLASLRLFHYGGAVFPNPYTAVAQIVPGKRLDIAALPTGKRVNVNLFRANHEYALQLSIRFNEGVVVRNAMVNHEWGVEEREGDFVLNRNEIFDLTIVNDINLQIFFNGQRFCTFAHRGSPTDIQTLEIEGNVEISTVTINDALPK